MNRLWFQACLSCGVVALLVFPVSGQETATAALPITREVADYADFAGRLAPMTRVDIRARVTGQVEKVHFKDGSLVKKGDLLFELDPRVYQATLEKSQAELAVAEARLKRVDAELARAKTLLPLKAITREDYDKIAASQEEARAQAEVSRAAIALAKLNLSYTKIVAPMNGRVGRCNLDAGNLAAADQTILVTVTSEGPLLVFFDLDERTYLRLKKEPKEDKGLTVLMGLATDEGFPHRLVVAAWPSEVDEKTGTIRMRATVPNNDGALKPGLFARVRLPLGKPAKAVLVSEKSIGTDNGQKYVYVVDGEGVVTYRRVNVGAAHEGLRIIREGVAPDEWVVVGNLEKLRPKMKVTVEKTVLAERKE
jgi:RND family efflux transporter MFP subunit